MLDPKLIELSKVIAEQSVFSISPLGLRWEPNTDVFVVQISLMQIFICIKRSILSFVSRQFDPLGFLLPVAIVGKLL